MLLDKIGRGRTLALTDATVGAYGSAGMGVGRVIDSDSDPVTSIVSVAALNSVITFRRIVAWLDRRCLSRSPRDDARPHTRQNRRQRGEVLVKIVHTRTNLMLTLNRLESTSTADGRLMALMK